MISALFLILWLLNVDFMCAFRGVSIYAHEFCTLLPDESMPVGMLSQSSLYTRGCRSHHTPYEWSLQLFHHPDHVIQNYPSDPAARAMFWTDLTESSWNGLFSSNPFDFWWIYGILAQNHPREHESEANVWILEVMDLNSPIGFRILCCWFKFSYENCIIPHTEVL